MSPRHFLSVCVFLRNEADYFSEWVNFHRLQGVDHFYVYHNADNDDLETLRVIASEGKRGGDITYVKWPGVAMQCRAYQHCIETCGERTEWLAIIDTDEFLHSRTYDTVAQVLADRRLTYGSVGAIAVHWILYGSNGLKEQTDGLVLERFTRRAAHPDNHVKSICRPAATLRVGPDPHTVLLKDGFSVIGERGVEYPREYAHSQRGSAEILQIAHYHTKSYSEFMARRTKNPDANSGRVASHQNLEERFAVHDKNEVEDTWLRDTFAQKIIDLGPAPCLCSQS